MSDVGACVLAECKMCLLWLSMICSVLFIQL